MSELSGATQVAGVIGDPVTHSLSPALHNAAFAALGLDWVYVAFPVASGRAADAVAAMRRTLESLGAGDNGSYLNFDGQPLAW